MKKIIALLLLITGYQLLVTNINAQTPAQIILTWQANNFYPADYSGKASVTSNTPVGVAAEVVKNNKLLDLQRANFTWLLDEKLLARGEGLKEVSFIAKKPIGDNHFLRVIIKLGEETFENAVRVPIERPRVVVESGLANNTVPPNSEVNLVALPYFFNINSLDDLDFSWQVNNEKIDKSGKNELALRVGAPQTEVQKSIRVIATVESKLNILEFTREIIQIRVQ